MSSRTRRFPFGTALPSGSSWREHGNVDFRDPHICSSYKRVELICEVKYYNELSGEKLKQVK